MDYTPGDHVRPPHPGRHGACSYWKQRPALPNLGPVACLGGTSGVFARIATEA